MTASWPHLLRRYPNITARGAAMVMQVPVITAVAEIKAFNAFLVKRPSWLQLVARYPRIADEDAGYVMGVNVDKAHAQVEHARRSLRKPIDHRTSGSRKIACKIVHMPLRNIKISEEAADPFTTKEFREKPENANLNIHRGAGSLRAPLDGDTIDMLPSQLTMVEPDSLGSKWVDTREHVSHNPGVLWDLPKDILKDRHGNGMSYEDRILIGDLSLTKGDMTAMRQLQREQAERLAEKAVAA